MPFRSDPTRRDVLKLGAATAVAPFAGLVPRASRRVIVAGGGIGGLCCAYELMRRGQMSSCSRPPTAPAVTCTRIDRGWPTACT